MKLSSQVEDIVHITGTYMQRVRAFEAACHLIAPDLALTDEQLASISVAPDQHAAYLMLRSQSHTLHRRLTQQPSLRVYVRSVRDVRDYPRSGVYLRLIASATAPILEVGDGGDYWKPYFSISSPNYAGLDPDNEVHRQLCALLHASVAEFNQLEASIAENAKQPVYDEVAAYQ